MEYNKSHIAFLPIALGLLAYWLLFSDHIHHFVLNTGWESNAISAEIVVYTVVALGVFFTVFYGLMRKLSYSRTLVRLHIVFYLLLVLTLIFWERNVFSFRESIDGLESVNLQSIKVNYQETSDLNDYFRSAFWFFMVGQTICFFNLFLGFFKNKVGGK